MALGPEEIRLRYLYRRLVLTRQARIPLEAAKQLMGPDCAFHLYASTPPTAPEASQRTEADPN